MDPLRDAQLQFLPTHWTPTDQVIMEDLLLHNDDDDAPVKPLYMHTACESGSESGGSVRQASSSSSHTASSSSSPSPSSSGDSTVSSPAVSSHQMRAVAKKEKDARPSKVSDEERRARHRAVQKRFVQRKKVKREKRANEAIKQTKKLAAELEQQYQFLQISAESRSLQKENEVLQAQHAAVRASPSPQGDPSSRLTPASVHAILADQMELVREFFEPLSLTDWTTHLRQNLDEYDVAAQDRSYLTSGLTVMGWHDQRKVDDASVKFVLSKEFVNVRAVDLMHKTWAQLSSPQTHAQFFSPVFTVKVQILQVINDNALVIHRALFNPQTGGISHALDLLCRVQRGHDFIIFESAIDHNAVHACLSASHKWTKMTISQVFSPSPSALTNPSSNGMGCTFRHGGWLRHFVASNVRYWFMEMFFMTLRYALFSTSSRPPHSLEPFASSVSSQAPMSSSCPDTSSLGSCVDLYQAFDCSHPDCSGWLDVGAEADSATAGHYAWIAVAILGACVFMVALQWLFVRLGIIRVPVKEADGKEDASEQGSAKWKAMLDQARKSMQSQPCKFFIAPVLGDDGTTTRRFWEYVFSENELANTFRFAVLIGVGFIFVTLSYDSLPCMKEVALNVCATGSTYASSISSTSACGSLELQHLSLTPSSVTATILSLLIGFVRDKFIGDISGAGINSRADKILHLVWFTATMVLAITAGVNFAATSTDDPQKPASLLLTIVVGVTVSSWVQEEVVKMVRNPWFDVMRYVVYRIWKARSAPKPAKVVQQTGVVGSIELVQVQLQQPGNAKEMADFATSR
ncbi:hypothetical protein FI667_g3277, partial [Globisporangium splendens]